MGYLDQLRELCSKMQETSQTKEEIDTSVQLKNIVDGLEAEEAQTLKNYNELKASYKEAILHSSFGDKKPVDSVTNTGSIDFNEFLNKWTENQKTTTK